MSKVQGKVEIPQPIKVEIKVVTTTSDMEFKGSVPRMESLPPLPTAQSGAQSGSQTGDTGKAEG